MIFPAGQALVRGFLCGGRCSGHGSTCNRIVPNGGLVTVRGYRKVLGGVLEVVGWCFRRWRSITVAGDGQK